MASDIEKLLSRIYQGFFLRDILGFVVPGSFSLISIWVVLSARITPTLTVLPANVCANLAKSVVESCEIAALNWGAIGFLGIAYLWAWVLQSLHYFVLNKMIPVGTIFPGKLLSLSSETLAGLEELISKQPTVTKGALQPDLIKAKSMTKEQLERQLAELPYTERASALMLLSANLGTAFVVLTVTIVLAIPGLWWLGLLLILSALVLYYEHRRIWNFRNLQLAVYAAGLREKPESSSGPKVSNGPHGVTQG